MKQVTVKGRTFTQLERREEMIGKTIKAVNRDDKLAISFTDNSFIFFHGEPYDDSHIVEVSRYFDNLDLHDIDLISYEEWKELYAEQQREKEDKERAQYEQLKAKFETQESGE